MNYKTLQQEMQIMDKDVVRWNAHHYLIRLSPIEDGVQVKVSLEDDPTVWHSVITDNDPDCLFDATWDCVGTIESIMWTTWEDQEQAILDEDRAVQMIRY